MGRRLKWIAAARPEGTTGLTMCRDLSGVRPTSDGRDAAEKKALADIEEHGCHGIHVLEDEEGPPLLLLSRRAEDLRRAGGHGDRAQAAHRSLYGERVQQADSGR